MQAKRVNIGVSLITDPQVLYLDEPTSGLDSFTADEVMSFVAKFARQYNRAVCATIHSPTPRTFGVFDRLMLLVAGRLVYAGPCGLPAVRYFVGARPPPPWPFRMRTSAVQRGIIFLGSLESQDQL